MTYAKDATPPYYHGNRADLAPGDPTKSYRSRDPLRVVGEVAEWQGHSPEQLRHMKDHLQRLKEQGIEAID